MNYVDGSAGDNIAQNKYNEQKRMTDKQET